MSLVITSTTDSQDDINAAAGLETPPETTESTQPVPAPAEKPIPEEEPDTEEDGDEEEPQEQPKRPRGGYLRKIEHLERQNGYAARQIEELQAQLQGRRQAPEPERPAGPPQAPNPDTFPSYDDYVKAQNEYVDRLTDWKLEQREAQMVERARQWQAQERERQAMQTWTERIGEFRSKAKDFDEVLAQTDHLQIPPEVAKILIESDNGPQLAYELARQPKELERIVKLQNPLAAARELGRFEAKLSGQAEMPKRAAAVSKAPEPIEPVGQGAVTSTKPPEEMSYQEYKEYRARQIAARRRRSA
jgi:hypothetical protein